MGETTVGHVAGEVVRALYGAGYMESTIGQYRKSIRALERYAGGPDAVYTRGLGAGFAASTFSERTGGFSRQRWFDYGRLARLCDSYLRSGSVDLGKWCRSRLAEPVVPGLAVVMERWEAYLSRRFGTGFGDGGALPSDGGLVPHVAGISWGRVVGRFGWLACAGVPGRAAFTLVGVVDAARRVGPAPVVQMARAG